MMWRRWTAVAAVVGAVALAGGCSSDDSSDTSKSTSSSRASSSTSTSAPAAEPATVKTAESSLGTILVAADGMALYLYASDTATTSNVPEALLAAWPPLTATGTPVSGDGVDASKLSTATGSDGSQWVTYNGHFLYRYAGDSAAGQTNGQGLGNVWYVVSPEGDQITS